MLKIAITDCGKYENYRKWIESESGVTAVKLSMHLQNADELDGCDGVLFSGGEDLQPYLYGKPEYLTEFDLKEIIPGRDHFEYAVLESALRQKKPVLGICRGLQLINVFLGGTLIPDIPSLLNSQNHGKINGVDQQHVIRVEKGSYLEKITGQETGIVNSAHHQSVDQPANSLQISAYSEPGVVEAMEWKDPLDKSWLMMVQWHPERMQNLSSPFSSSVKTAFLSVCQSAQS